MLTLFLLALLLAALLVPPLALLRRADRLGWAARYGLAVLPAAYTWGGYRLAVLAIDWFACQGGMKGLHACTCAGLDVTPLVGHGLFLTGLCASFAGAIPTALAAGRALSRCSAC